MRDEAQKRASAIQAAGKRKRPPSEVCGLFNTFSAAENKLIRYVAKNSSSCGIPPQVLEGMKKQHAKTTEIRTRVCRIAAAQQQQRPRGPSLSDALNAPVPDSANVKTGRGTYDTLTGNALGK